MQVGAVQGLGRVMLAAFAVAGSVACAHAGRQADGRPLVLEGRYAVESIRSRALLDGVDQVIEISEAGTKLVDQSGSEHTLTERGALVLTQGGTCRLALAVSVDGDEPGISDRPCSWGLEGDRFFLGDGGGGDGTRTIYQVHRSGNRVVLEGVVDLGPDGKVMGDAKGERIVLVEGEQPYTAHPADRTNEQATREAAEMINEL